MKLAAIVAALAAGWTVVAVILGRHLKGRDEMWPEVDDDEPADGAP